MERSETRNVAIVGAGVAGLCTAKTLMAQGLDCKVFERSEAFGGVWADGYLGYGVQVQKELYEYPDWPLPADTPDFTPGPLVRKYLEGYAAHFGLTPQIRLRTRVVALTAREDSTVGWWVTLQDATGTRREAFDSVVIATGLYSSIPYLPEFPGQEKFQGKILHNSGLRSCDQLLDKRVAVLGYGKSATDAALEAAKVARETHIIIREPHWPVPPKLAGIVPFKWGLLNRMTSALIPLYQRPSAGERFLHGPLEPLARMWWRGVETLLKVQCGLGGRLEGGENLVPDIPVEIDSFGESTMFPNAEFFRAIRRGRITAHRTGIASYQPSGVTLKDGRQLDLDLVILATGWRNDDSFFSEGLRQRLGFEDDGLYLYRHILHPETPGLAFIGRVATPSCILTASLQARWLAEFLAGRHRLPDRAGMLREIEDMKVWKRTWMPYSSQRGARLQLHMLHYHDELLCDFGASPKRKKGLFAPIKELLAPYEPSDYRSIVAGEQN